ncbi:T9SS type A sorting domain-containing protein [Niastella sp. OAS944]|uniref:DUF7619 domain-containing protein n=1 Tax=Niastella sp. OAS944 TaxID=2664089 RepID=UPI00346A986B|nr:hypothetical protein [Chitinophagaceae bacterium OAS944]
MRKSILLTVIFFAAVHFCNAQGKAPGLKWQKIWGAENSDELTGGDRINFIDRDGKYLLGFSSNSTTGLYSGNHSPTGIYPTSDIWVAKLDEQRNIIWNVSLGGSASEGIGSLQLAHDSGYIVAGGASSNNGDVTGHHGNGDAWVVRLGNNGNIIWQKCYGGSLNDHATYVERTPDGYILLGNTASNDGDVSGSHGTTYDIWVAKLDKNGNMLWQKCLGGSNNEYPGAIKQTADGGYILTGSSNSWDGDVQGSHSVPVDTSVSWIKPDAWVVKLDRNGTIEWQKCLGGTGEDSGTDIEITPAGDYIISCGSSSTDGDVTGLHQPDPYGGISGDAWIVNLSATGVIKWQKCFGGSDGDNINDIQMLPDKTFVGVGGTSSNDGDVSLPSGTGSNCWLINFDGNGNLIWEKSFGAASTDYGLCLTLKNNGNIVIGGWALINWVDMWMFEVGASNTIAGRVFYDANSDGFQNNGELAFDKVTVRSGKNGDTTSAIPYKGYYTMDVDSGTYVTKAVPYSPYYSIVPATKTTTFNSYFNTDSIHFAVQPLPNLRDVNVSILPLTVARPGFTAQYKIIYKNVGTNTVATGSIQLIKDTRLTLTGSQPTATVNGNNLTWNFSNLAPNTEAFITLNFVVAAPPATNIGDTLKSKVWIEHDGTDVTPNDDTAILKQVVIGSFDPNDKTESHGGIITPDQISGADPLTYLIRFQNTGTDTAFNITVRDTLDSRLDWSSLQMIASSHAYQLSIDDGNKLTWKFNDIKLPYTGIDEPNSHGYIAYKIKPKPTVQLGDIIKNTAGIYFDYNLPIATNTEKTAVLLLTPLPVTLTRFHAAEDGDVVNVSWATSMEEHIKQFEVLRSSNGIDFTTIGKVKPGMSTYLFIDKQPLKGYNYYQLRSVDADGSFTLSTIVLVNLKNGADIISSLYPNPATGNATLKLQGTVEGNVQVQVLDQQGRLVTTKQFGVQHTAAFKTPLDLGHLARGSYVLRIMVNDKIYLHKLLIQ